MGCVSDGADPTMAADGDTVTCLPPPATIDRIWTTASDLTVNIGTDAIAAEVNDIGIGVNMSSPGVQTLNMLNATSTINASSIGVRMRAEAGSLDRIINSQGSIIGGDDGIEVYAGAQTVNVNAANVTGMSRYGINILTLSTTTGVAITSSESIFGGATGIRVTPERGSGALMIDVNDVTGVTDDGVFVDKRAGTDVLITAAGTITGGNHGVYATNTSTAAGAFDISVGNVTGTSGHGIFATTGAAATGLSISSTGAIVGGDDGVSATNNGDGTTTVTVTDVSGGLDAGIEVFNTAAAGAMTITSTGAVTGGNEGIDAVHSGAGALTIDAMNVSGASEDAIFASATALSDGVSIVARGDVNGADNGVNVANESVGLTTIDIAGSVVGTSEFGVLSQTVNGSSITVRDGASVTGATAAISTSGLGADDFINDVVSVGNSASINGDILLNNGDDIFNDAGATFTGVSGGAGFDIANFDGPGRAIDGSGAAGDVIREFEVFNFNSGDYDLTGSHLGLDSINFYAGQNKLNGGLDVATLTIANGAALTTLGGSNIDGVLVNNGAVDIGGAGIDTLLVDNFMQGANGVLTVNFDGAEGDRLISTGDVMLAGELEIAGATGLLPGRNYFKIIDGGTSLNGAFDHVSNGTLLQQSIEYDRDNFDVNITLTLNSASSIVGLTQNQMNIGDNLVGLLADPSLDMEFSDFIFAIARLDGVENVQAALDELHPESLDMGLKFLGASQQAFLDTVVDQLDYEPSESPVRIASLGRPPAADFKRGGPIYWGGFRGASLNQNATAEHIGFGGESYEYLAGVSGLGAGDVTLSLAGGYSSYLGQSAGALGDEIDAYAYRFAAALSSRFSDGIAGAFGRAETIVSFATGNSDITRYLVNPMSGDTVSQAGAADFSMLSWRTRLSVDGVKGGEWPVTPFIQFGLDRYQQDETAIGVEGDLSALMIDELENLRLAVGGGAAFEHQWRDDMGLAVKAAAVQYFVDTENIFTSRFAAAPGGSPAFQTIGDAVERQIRLDANLFYTHESGFTFSAGAFGETGDLDVYGGRLAIIGGF